MLSPTKPSARLRGTILRAAQAIVVVAGFIAVLAAATIPAWHGAVSAVYCGSGYPTSSYLSSSIGGTYIDTQIEAYGDPGCSGTYNRAFNHFSGATAVIDIYFWPSIGTRAWSCGNLSYSHTGGATANILVDYGPSVGSSSCVLQADQWTRYGEEWLQ